MSRFQERLWDELVRDHGAALAYPAGFRDPSRPAPIVEPRRRGMRVVRDLPAPRLAGLPLHPGGLAATLAALAAALATVAILSTTGTAPSAAYAVTQNPDGTITVTIDEIAGVVGANAQLARLGVRAKVVPVQAGCSAPTGIVPTPLTLVATIAHPQGQGMAIRPDLVPTGTTLILTARQAGSVVDLSYSLYRGAVPSCIGVGENHAG